MPENYKDQIYALVQRGNTAQAIELGTNIARQLNSAALREWTLLNNRHDKVKRGERIGTLSYAEASREYNQITLAVLELAGELEGDATVLEIPPADPAPPVLVPENKILFLASNPSDTARLQQDAEFARLSHHLEDGHFTFQLRSAWAVTPETIQSLILRQKPRIIHFSGHGLKAGVEEGVEGLRALAPRSNDFSGGIVLQDQHGKSREVSGAALEEMFAIFAEVFALEVVVLNACYSGEQAEAINRHVPYVVGMKKAIRDTDAIAFSSSFYMALAQMNKVSLAFRLACNQIRLNGNLGGGDIPVLHSRS